MNKKFLGLGGAIAFTVGSAFVGSPEARAEEPYHCVSVYDETMSGVSPALQRVIDAYAAKQIAIHVEIDKQAPSGVSTAPDIANYQTKKAQACGYAGTAYVDVSLMLDKRQYNVQKDGKADQEVATNAVQAATTQFQSDLRDTTTPYQDDVATLLETVNPDSQKPQNQPTKNPSTQPSMQPENTTPTFEMPDIPVIPMLYTGGILVVLGAVGVRARRQHVLRTMYDGAVGDLESETTESAKLSDAIGQALQNRPSDDVGELKSAAAQLMTQAASLEDGQATARRVHGQSRRQMWPSLEDATSIADEMGKLVRATAGKRAEVQQLLEADTQQKDKLSERVDEFNSLCVSLQETIENLRSSDWDVTDAAAKLDEFSKLQSDIQQQCMQGYVKKPTQIIEKHLEDVRTLNDELIPLQDDRDRVDDSIAEQQAGIVALTETATLAQAKLESLKNQYSPSCYEDILNEVADLGVQLVQLGEVQQSAKAGVGQKSIAALRKSEELVAEFTKISTGIQNTADAVETRRIKLVTIKENLPAAVAQLDDTFEAVRKYAFETYDADVEDSTRQAIQKATDDFKKYKAEDISAEKPEYLKIEEKNETFTQRCDALALQARKEKAEMDGLRTNLANLQQQATDEYENYQEYVRLHSGDVGVASTFNIPSVSGSGLRRLELREANTDFNKLVAKIQTARRDAQEAVRSAEEERRRQEAARLAALAAAEAERQAEIRRQSEASSPTNIGGGWSGGSSNVGGSW